MTKQWKDFTYDEKVANIALYPEEAKQDEDWSIRYYYYQAKGWLEQAFSNMKQAMENFKMCAELIKLDREILKEQVEKLEKEKVFLKDELRKTARELDRVKIENKTFRELGAINPNMKPVMWPETLERRGKLE